MANYEEKVFVEMGGISNVVSTLPAGAILGEERFYNGVKYRLFFNAGNSQISKGRGFVQSTTVGNGPYSVTVSTITETATGFAGVLVNATAATSQYFWGAVGGGPVAVLVSNVSIATGAKIMPAADGNFTLTATSVAAVGRNQGATATTDAVGGGFFIYAERVPWF